MGFKLRKLIRSFSKKRLLTIGLLIVIGVIVTGLILAPPLIQYFLILRGREVITELVSAHLISIELLDLNNNSKVDAAYVIYYLEKVPEKDIIIKIYLYDKYDTKIDQGSKIVPRNELVVGNNTAYVSFRDIARFSDIKKVIVKFYTIEMELGVPNKITWYGESSLTNAIWRVASGESDIFYHGIRKSSIPPEALPNLTLIQQSGAYYGLVFNIAHNVIDPNAPGNTTIAPGVTVPGQYIPGLLLVEPENWIPTAPDMYYNVNWTDINSTMYIDLFWNPLAIREIRFAFNYLISRDYITTNIFQKDAVPMYCAVIREHPSYAELFKHVCEEKYGFTPTGDVERAREMYFKAIIRVNATLSMYNMALKLVNGWLTFVRPNGEEVPVRLNFLIRNEDERKDIGLYVADLIETYFNLKVNRIVKPRVPLVYTAYFTNLVERDPYGSIPVDDTYEPRVWHIYTEGWLTTIEMPWHWLRDYPAFFYLPFAGLGPNDPTNGWIWYGNDTLYNLSRKLRFEVYINETELKNDMILGMDYGVWEQIRTFLVNEVRVFIANKYSLVNYTAGYLGLYNPWAARSLRFTKNEVIFLQFTTSFTSWFNPILGFKDIYTENIHRFIADYDYWTYPDNCVYKPMRIDSYYVYQTYPANITVASITGYVYDPIIEKWVHISKANPIWLADSYGRIHGVPVNEIIEGTYKIHSYVEVKYKSIDGVTLGKWHDGSNITIADIMYILGFWWEWGYYDTRVTGLPDPYYWNIDYTDITRLYGVKIINYTTIAYWVNYADVLPIYVADQADVWPDMPWQSLHAGEEIIINPAYIHNPSGRRWGWDTAYGRQAIDYITYETTIDIKEALISLKASTAMAPKIPPYISTYPDSLWVSYMTADVDSRYSDAISFINIYGHSYVSNGPYYIAYYDPVAFIMILKYFEP